MKNDLSIRRIRDHVSARRHRRCSARSCAGARVRRADVRTSRAGRYTLGWPRDPSGGASPTVARPGCGSAPGAGVLKAATPKVEGPELVPPGPRAGGSCAPHTGEAKLTQAEREVNPLASPRCTGSRSAGSHTQGRGSSHGEMRRLWLHVFRVQRLRSARATALLPRRVPRRGASAPTSQRAPRARSHRRGARGARRAMPRASRAQAGPAGPTARRPPIENRCAGRDGTPFR